MSTELDYAYLAPSKLEVAGSMARLGLSTSGGMMATGLAKHPFFFSGFVEHPAATAQALLTLARVARTRFYVPPNMLAALLRAADPVVTATAEGLRFESFSACCGVYARLDVDASALDVYHLAAGVTNVDVNPPLRQALASLSGSAPLHLDVGSDELRVTTLEGTVVEEKVTLPTRWLKGFAETQMLAAGMSLRHELDAAATRQFAQALPRQSATKTVMWATRVARGLRLGSQPGADAVCVAGPERLRVIEPLLRFANRLRVYGPEVEPGALPTASAWEFELPGGRLSIGLSPEKARGFSGEGSVLHALSGAQVGEDAEMISTMLSFEPRIDVPALVSDTGIDAGRVNAALNLLASSGQVGYDLAAGAYFHRPLPVRADALQTLHPRLADAKALVAGGAVVRVSENAMRVHSGDIAYDVRLAADPADDQCACPWWAKYRGTRGPCKHVLAARMADRGEMG
ncbi:MAG: SWIM zinc finger domain-containing protein [Betaproteobacteria bacterium]|nr:SWIM zinc finger domain-containing protein [Betaproteobacteria bacterium]